MQSLIIISIFGDAQIVGSVNCAEEHICQCGYLVFHTRAYAGKLLSVYKIIKNAL